MSEHGHPEHDTRRRFWIALALAVPLVCIEMAGARGSLPFRVGGLHLPWLELLLATPVVLWCCWPMLQRGWRSVVQRQPAGHALAAFGAVLAYGFSAVATLLPARVSGFDGPGDQPALLFGTAAFIVTLALLSELLELQARQRAGAALLDLPGFAPPGKSQLQGFANRVSVWVAAVVMAVALLAALAWWALGPEPKLANALVVAVGTLVVASPAALELAAPVALLAALGRGAQSGVLFRSAEPLERLRDVDTVVFDRTGALTTGRPEVVSVIPVDGIAESELLRFAASLEQAGTHPVAAAIVAAANARGLKLGRSTGFRTVPGRGALGVVQLRNVVVGNAALMQEVAVDVRSLEPEAQRLRALGQTVVYVGLDGVPVGLVGVADALKPEAWEVMRQLRAQGMRLVLLSGDHEETVRAVAAQLGIGEVTAGVLPDARAARVAELRATGAMVAMVGDGVADAPAFAAADVGIAVGGAADNDGRAAGITLVSGNLNGLAEALRLSEATMRNVGHNLSFALGYNVLGVVLAAGALYPLAGRLLPPTVAAVAMVLGTVVVLHHALRLRSMRI